MARRKTSGHIDAPPVAAGEIWIFAYGSLMWEPGFPFVEARPALLRGYHRAFCLYSHRYRGTPEKPGLVLGLDSGGACRGIAYRVTAKEAPHALKYLWDREMLNLSYVCRELKIEVGGKTELAYAFVVRRDQEQYAGKLPPERVVELIRQGMGMKGACSIYLENTVRHLDQLGMPDRGLSTLLKRVRAAGAS